MLRNSQKDINEHRNEIDNLDSQIVDLLNKRAVHSLAVRDIKNQENIGIYDPHREDEILDLICAHNEGPLYDDHLREIYVSILKAMKEIPANER